MAVDRAIAQSMRGDTGGFAALGKLSIRSWRALCAHVQLLWLTDPLAAQGLTPPMWWDYPPGSPAAASAEPVVIAELALWRGRSPLHIVPFALLFDPDFREILGDGRAQLLATTPRDAR